MKEDQVSSLREMHPQLLLVETALISALSELAQAIADRGEGLIGEHTHRVEVLQKRLDDLRKERLAVLDSLSLPDDYSAPVYKCPLCLDSYVVRIDGVLASCTCLANRTLDIQREKAGITDRMIEQTFDSFSLDHYSGERRKGEADSQQNRAEKLLEAAQELVRCIATGVDTRGLYIFGNPGVGKTHLAVAIANALISEGIDVRYRVSTSMLQDIRASFDSNRAEGDLSANEILDDLVQTPLLILDDIGVEKFTPWAVETLYNLINSRDQKGKPIVFSSNLPVAQLEEEMGVSETAVRITSRIAGSCRLYLLDGEDLRYNLR